MINHYLYLIFDERARLMPNEQCVCLLATDNKKEALNFAKENRGVVFQYLTQGDKIINNTEEQLN
jgi:uncharacterized protein (DUF924 family)